jgi:PAS domain S-box-containing protein
VAAVEPTCVGDGRAQDLEATRLRAQLAIDAAGIGTFDWDLTTRQLTWDARLIEMFGYEADTFEQTIEAFNARLHPDDLPRVTEALQTAIATRGELETDYRILLPDGDTRWVSARGKAFGGAGGPAARVIGVAYDVTAEHAGEARVTRVLEAMPAGFYSLDRDWRFTHVNAQAERLLQHTREELLGQVIWDAFPATVNGIFEESYRRAVATGEPIAFDAHYPAPLNGWYELRAWPTPDGLSVYFIEVTERRQAEAQADRAARRLTLLAQVSAELASTLDVGAATARLPRIVVPALADYCILTVIDADGHPRDVGSWHVDPASREVLERYAEVRLDAMPLTAPVGRALHANEAVTFAGDDVLELLPPGRARDLLSVLAPNSEVALPLRARGRTLGLLTLFFSDGHQPTPEDVSVAQDVADRAGLAWDNARLFGQQQQMAEVLQRSLLTDPPEPDHAEIVVRYLPAAEAARVGGDWYDAFLQPNGSTMLVIGDVVGDGPGAQPAARHRRIQRRRSGRGAARAGLGDVGAADRHPGDRGRGPVRADPRRACPRPHPDDLGQRGPPAAAGAASRRQRRRPRRLEGRPAAGRGLHHGSYGLGGHPGSRVDRAALHRRSDRAPGRRPRHRAEPAADPPGRAGRAAAPGTVRRADHPAGRRQARGRRRGGRRPTASPGPPPPRRGRSQPRARRRSAGAHRPVTRR